MPDSTENTVTSPRLARRRVAYGLAEMREELGWSQKHAASVAGVGASRIANVEIRRNLPSEDLLRTLLHAYEREDELDEYLALRTTARQRDPSFRGLNKNEFLLGFDEFVDLESAAEQIDGYEHRVVPGILQTRDYAARAIRARRSITNLERKVEVRQQRQRALTRESNPVHLWMIIEEQALDRPVGAADVMRDQFGHLLTLAELPNVELQIAPTSLGPHQGMTSAFCLLRFRSPRDPGVVAVEVASRTIFLEDPGEITQFAYEMDHLRTLALPQEASAELINQKRKEL